MRWWRITGLASKSATAAVALAALLAATPAHAGENSFSGSCLFPGMMTLSQPVNGVPERVTYTLESERNVGRCDGELNGDPIAYAPSYLKVEGPALVGCSAAAGTGAPGALTFTGGTLTPVDDVQLPLLVDMNGSLTEWNLTLRGAASGLAGAHLTYLEGVGQSDAERCAPGHPNGFQTLAFGLQLETASALTGVGAEVPLRASLSARRQRLATVLRRGLAVRLATNAPVTGLLTATVGGTSVARAQVRNDSVTGGRLRARLPLSRAGRRLLRSGGPRAVVVTATVRHVSGKSATAAHTVRLGGER